MHSAASVSYPVVRSRRGGLWLAGLWLAALSPVGFWLAAVPASGALRTAVLLWSLGLGVLAALWWLRTPAVGLAWDGLEWSVQDDSKPASISRPLQGAQLSVAHDFQTLLLLRLEAPGCRGRWLLADQSAALSRWHALRCAVTASAGASSAAELAEVAR